MTLGHGWNKYNFKGNRFLRTKKPLCKSLNLPQYNSSLDICAAVTPSSRLLGASSTENISHKLSRKAMWSYKSSTVFTVAMITKQWVRGDFVWRSDSFLEKRVTGACGCPWNPLDLRLSVVASSDRNKLSASGSVKNLWP